MLNAIICIRFYHDIFAQSRSCRQIYIFFCTINLAWAGSSVFVCIRPVAHVIIEPTQATINRDVDTNQFPYQWPIESHRASPATESSLFLGMPCMAASCDSFHTRLIVVWWYFL